MLEAGGGGLVEEAPGNNLPGNSLPGNNLPGKGIGNGMEEMVDDNKRLQVGMEELDKHWHC